MTATAPSRDQMVSSPQRAQGEVRIRWLLARIGLAALSAAITLLVVLGVWIAFLRIFSVPAFVGRSPLDVWHYLATDTAANINGSAAAHRSAILDESLITIRDASIGLLFGTVLGIAVAAWFSLSRLAAHALTPAAMLLRSVPLIAMTPLIVAVFGRGLVAVGVVGALVAFFPTLVNVSLALDSSSDQSLDLCRAYGAGKVMALRKIRIPNAIPGLFAALRIAAPLAFVGALLAEDLATGNGLGSTMLTDAALSQYDGVWSRVAVATVLSTSLYIFIGAVERVAVRLYAPDRG